MIIDSARFIFSCPELLSISRWNGFWECVIFTKYQIYLAGLLIFISFAAHVAATDFLDVSNSQVDSAAKQDAKDTLGNEALFNSAVDVRGKATPVITGTNVAGATVNTGPDTPKKRLLSPSEPLAFGSSGHPGSIGDSGDEPVK